MTVLAYLSLQKPSSYYPYPYRRSHRIEREVPVLNALFRLLLPLVLVLTSPPSWAQSPEELASYPDPSRWEETIQAFEQQTRDNPPPAGVVMFYGSSSIGGWHGTLAKDMAPLHVLGRGFGGSTLWDALHFLDRVVITVRPTTILLYEGENDIGAFGVSPDVVSELFQRFVHEVRAELPSTRIFFLSIKPSPSRWDSWPRMQEANAVSYTHLTLPTN